MRGGRTHLAFQALHSNLLHPHQRSIHTFNFRRKVKKCPSTRGSISGLHDQPHAVAPWESEGTMCPQSQYWLAEHNLHLLLKRDFPAASAVSSQHRTERAHQVNSSLTRLNGGLGVQAAFSYFWAAMTYYCKSTLVSTQGDVESRHFEEYYYLSYFSSSATWSKRVI